MRKTAVRRFLVAGAVLAALIALAAIASGCGVGVSGMGDMGDMDEMHRQMHGGGSQAPQTPVVSDAPQMTVEIRDFDFFPREPTVERGTTITWVNRDTVPHDASDEGGAWSTAMLKQGESDTLTFDSPGTYQYLCSIHPNMKATVTVA
jgi:plastocyanin